MYVNFNYDFDRIDHSLIYLTFFYLATAHCADMYPDSDSDPEELKQARQTISDTIGKWLQEF